MKLLELKCKNCGAALKVKPDTADIHCDHCKAYYKLDDEVQHIKYDDMEKAGYDYEKGKQKARQEHEQQKKIEADKQRIEKIRKSQTKTESFIYNRIHSAISKQVMQETIEKDVGVTPITNHVESKKSDSSNKQSPADFVSQNNKKIIIGVLIALFVVAPLILVGSLLFSPLKGNDSDIASVHYSKDNTPHKDTDQNSEPKPETENKEANEPSEAVTPCQKDLQGFTPKEGIYNDILKIRITDLSAECDAYSGWNYYTATLEITNIDTSHDKQWYRPSLSNISSTITRSNMAYYPSVKPDELPSDLPQRSCNGIKENGEYFSIAKSQTVKSAICGWAPSNAKNIIYSYYYQPSDYSELLDLTLLTKE